MSERELEEVVAFLCGEGQLEGRWFGDAPPRVNGRLHPYWWRKNLRAALADSRQSILEEAAKVAERGCLVPPDGGSPTEAEREMCEAIAAAIRSLSPDRKAPAKEGDEG